MNDPTLIPRDALAGRRVGLSVSESSDLAALGLSERHCRMVVAEVTRAILLAGGTVVYGGRLEPEGYTRVLLDEIQRFKEGFFFIGFFLAATKFGATAVEKLDETTQRLGALGRLRFVDFTGSELRLRDTSRPEVEFDDADAYSAMRGFVARDTDSRVVVGGQLTGYKGHEPGIIEEARLSLEAGAELYIAGGYGGAGALLALALRGNGGAWAPPGFPRHAEDLGVQRALDRFLAVSKTADLVLLPESDAQTLEASHRPADIATTVARALASQRRRGR